MRAIPILAVSWSLALLLPSCRNDGGFVFSSFSTDEQASRNEERPLELAQGQRLTVDLPAGEVRIAAGNGAPRVEARLWAGAPTPELAEQVLARYALEVSASEGGARVQLVGEPLEHSRGRTTMRLGARADLDITVPPGVALTVGTRSGDITVRGPIASADIDSGYGAIRFEETEATGPLEITTSSGGIALSRVRAPEIRAESGYGKIELDTAEAATIRLETRSGDLRIADCAGSIRAHSGYGTIALERVRGDAEARSQSGDLTLAQGQEGPWILETGYGKVRVRGIDGRLRAETSSGAVDVADVEGSIAVESGYGSVDVEGVLAELSAKTRSGNVSVAALPGSTAERSWSLRSGYGSIQLSLPDSVACRLDARTDYGTIRSEHPMLAPTTDDAGRAGRRLRGTLGAGGGSVSIETTSGNVTIRR